MIDSSHCLCANNFIFISGWGFSAKMWKSLGFYAKSTYYMDFSYVFDDIDQWVGINQKMIPRSSTVVAWSFGALAAINMAYYYPAKVKKMILLSASPRFLSTSDWTGVDKDRAMMFHDHLVSDPFGAQNKFIRRAVGMRNKSRQQALSMHAIIAEYAIHMAHSLKIFYALDYRDMLSSLKIPIVFYIPAQDAIWPVSVEQLRGLNKHITCQISAVKGHAFLWEKSANQSLQEAILCM